MERISSAFPGSTEHLDKSSPLPEIPSSKTNFPTKKKKIIPHRSDFLPHRGGNSGENSQIFWFFSQRAHLGQGTRTNIYEGVLRGNFGNEEEAEYFSTEQNNNDDGGGREMRVVLKVLDPSHRDIALVRAGIRDLGSGIRGWDLGNVDFGG